MLRNGGVRGVHRGSRVEGGEFVVGTYLYCAPLTHTRGHRSTTFISERQQRSHAPNETLSQVLLGHKLAATETTRLEIDTLLCERDTTIERLEAGRRWLTEREQEERKR